MLSQEIRHNFLDFFKKKGHVVVPSSPVIPHNDPTLLFVNAGMNQFKDIFLGQNQRGYQKATTAQKCIRVGGKHNDLDNVGHTSRHLTFFEMLGNFSFGDYFKKEAIAFAWEVSTNIFRLEADKIWVTVFREDEEAFALWREFVPEERIVFLNEKDNFWAMGDTGPCGPCSELYFDRGKKFGDARSILEDTEGERYLEYWNLVFMQFDRTPSGELKPLPKKSIDTGSGLERLIALKMGVDNVFLTDILQELIAQVECVTGKKYRQDNTETAPAFHVIADHIRSLAFAIADGAQPSNVERGYVLRKLLRRCACYGKRLGVIDPFLAKILPKLMILMGEDYPELKEAENRIGEILTFEEESFFKTLRRGGNILQTVISNAAKRDQKEISGEEAFKLKDTYGLPLEEVLLIAKDSHLSVDINAYQIFEKEAKERSKGASIKRDQRVEENWCQEFAETHPPCKFVGYQQLQCLGKIEAIFTKGGFVPSIAEGQEGFIILDQTPFYAEMGGQVGDTGIITFNGASFDVSHCTSSYLRVIVHSGKCRSGVLSVEDVVYASVDGRKRVLIENNHTATHLLHAALGQILGSHIRQAGSIVDENHLRFDFHHHKALALEELRAVEEEVNNTIRENIKVQSYELSLEQAQKRGEIKQFFGDKYGETVRVIDIEKSKELCGGTHASYTGRIGYFRIVKESGIAAGVRRIEAVSGKAAEQFVYYKEESFGKKNQENLEKIKCLEKELRVAQKAILKEMADSLLQKSIKIRTTFLVSSVVSVENLSVLTEFIIEKLSSGVVILARRKEEGGVVMVRITSDLVKRGLRAADIIDKVSSIVEGSGGGHSEFATMGGKSFKNIDKVFEKIKNIIYTFESIG
jgi:alanyl-tRNA synthetase